VLGVVDWETHEDMLKMWAGILSNKQGHSLEPVYVNSDVETVSRLWPGTGQELGQMLKLSQDYGTKAWTKDGVTLLSMKDLNLKAGDAEGNLVSTKEAIRKLGLKL
jgi:hypothetical protein